jgi:hypothetical protein
MPRSPITQQIERRLEAMPEQISPLKVKARHYLQYCSAVDVAGEIYIGHQPWIAPLNYAITLFPPAKRTWIEHFKQPKIPPFYRDFLSVTNGLFAFGLSLYGLSPSLQAKTPSLDRGKLQCQDLATANTLWVAEYNIEHRQFHFGHRQHSKKENCGYFYAADEGISAISSNGRVLQTWHDFSIFLAEELDKAEERARANTPEDWWT